MEPELTAHFTLQKNQDLNSFPLLCMVLAGDEWMFDFLSATLLVDCSHLLVPRGQDLFVINPFFIIPLTECLLMDNFKIRVVLFWFAQHSPYCVADMNSN